jgi:hypothetical protein
MNTSLLLDLKHTSKVGFISVFVYGQRLAEQNSIPFEPAVIGDSSLLLESLEILNLDKVKPRQFNTGSRQMVSCLVAKLFESGALVLSKREVLNCSCKKVFLVSCFIPNFPHVMLVIFGAQGSSKSTLSKLARLVTDPSIIEVASLPNSTKELIQVLAHHYLIFFDNLSYISEEQSDTICKAITGSGFAKRELYENDEDIIYSFMRSIGINGINLVATRPDLLERSLLIELQRIDPIKRRSERELQEKFAKDLPVILGGIFDALVKTLRIRPTLEIDSLPRMADWSLWGCAIAEALGYSKEEFLSAYRKNIDHQVEMLLNENIVATAVVTFMEDKEEWRSTPTDFLTALKNHASLVNIDTQEKYWPKGANALSRKLNELSTPLKQMGILITISTSGTERWILIQKAPQNKPDQSDDTDGIPQIKQNLW